MDKHVVTLTYEDLLSYCTEVTVIVNTEDTDLNNVVRTADMLAAMPTGYTLLGWTITTNPQEIIMSKNFRDIAKELESRIFLTSMTPEMHTAFVLDNLKRRYPKERIDAWLSLDQDEEIIQTAEALNALFKLQQKAREFVDAVQEYEKASLADERGAIDKLLKLEKLNGI